LVNRAREMRHASALLLPKPNCGIRLPYRAGDIYCPIE
jgi:hypothetical protein